MARRVRDPYQVLGVSPDSSDAALRSAYHKLVQLHHPDHNAGSPDAARRFEEIQDAYGQITRLRRAASTPRTDTHASAPPPDPEVESRMADLERQVREAHQARERARRAATEAAARTEKRPSDEELGYVRTDDSLSKLLEDVRTELSEKFAQARTHPARERVADLIDELADRLRGEGR
jgi:hypothetical protein